MRLPTNPPHEEDVAVNIERAGRWYFGWNIVAAATLLTLLTVGIRLGVGPFFLPMSEDLGFSRSLLASIVAVGMLCYGFAMPLAGYLISRYGTRLVLLSGTAIVAASTAWTVIARANRAASSLLPCRRTYAGPP